MEDNCFTILCWFLLYEKSLNVGSSEKALNEKKKLCHVSRPSIVNRRGTVSAKFKGLHLGRKLDLEVTQDLLL